MIWTFQIVSSNLIIFAKCHSLVSDAIGESCGLQDQGSVFSHVSIDTIVAKKLQKTTTWGYRRTHTRRSKFGVRRYPLIRGEPTPLESVSRQVLVGLVLPRKVALTLSAAGLQAGLHKQCLVGWYLLDNPTMVRALAVVQQ